MVWDAYDEICGVLQVQRLTQENQRLTNELRRFEEERRLLEQEKRLLADTIAGLTVCADLAIISIMFLIFLTQFRSL